jgi:hypothetical protein
MTADRGRAWNVGAAGPVLRPPVSEPCYLCIGGSVYIEGGCPRCAETGTDRDPQAAMPEGFAIAGEPR